MSYMVPCRALFVRILNLTGFSFTCLDPDLISSAYHPIVDDDRGFQCNPDMIISSHVCVPHESILSRKQVNNLLNNFVDMSKINFSSRKFTDNIHKYQ